MTFYYILIFVSTGLFAFILIRMVTKYLQEKLELNSNKKYEALRRYIAPDKLLTGRVFAALIMGCIMFILQIVFGVEQMKIAIPVSCGFGLLAYHAVYWYYLKKMLNRKQAFENKILDFTMGLSNGMRSGLALGQSIESVAKRIGGPMQEELATLLREYRLGIDLPEAFERMYNRMPCEDLHLLVTTITLTTKSGGSLVEVLEEMVTTIRARTEFQERLKNMTAAGRFEALTISLAPLAAFILLYVIDSELMKPLITTAWGWMAVGFATLLVVIGYYVLIKITTIEV
jgi:tight adherence protein B